MWFGHNNRGYSAIAGPGPQAMWPGYVDSTSIDFGWWGPTTQTSFTVGAPDHYRVYRNGALLYGTLAPWTSGSPTGVTPDPQIGGGGGHAEPWFTDINLTPGTTYTYTVTCVDAFGNESAPGPPLVMTTLSNGLPVTPTPAVNPDTWIEPYALPTGNVWTVTQTAATAYNSVGGLGWAISQSDIDGNDIIVCPAGSANAIQLQNATAGATLKPYTGNNGWTYIVSSQDPGYQAGGTLIAYDYSPVNVGLSVFTLASAPASGATSATLASAWTSKTGYYYVVFSDQEERLCLFTNGSTAVTWTTYNGFYLAVGLTNAVTTTIQVAYLNGVTPADIESMATINFGLATGPCFNIPTGCNKVRFVGINMQQVKNRGSTIFNAVLFTEGTAGNSIPPAESIYFDRCIIGDDVTSTGYTLLQHGLQVACNHFLVHQCYFWGVCNGTGGDSNAILGQAGQYHCFQNSYISAVSESWIYGGIWIDQNYIPQDIVIRYCMSHKPLMWAPNNTSHYSAFFEEVKNLGEFKCAERVEIHGMLYLNCWWAAASGYHGAAIALGARDQTIFTGGITNYTGLAPWCKVTDVWAHDNQIYNCQSAFISFTADAITSYDARCKFSNNVCYISTINPLAGDPMQCVRLFGPCVDHIIDHNTFIMNSTLLMSGGGNNLSNEGRGFYFLNFGAVAGSYGSPSPYTPNAWHTYQDRSQFTNNVVDSWPGVGGYAFMFDTSSGGLPGFSAYTNLVMDKNLTINDPNTWGNGTINDVGYAGVGFVNYTNNTSIPLHPSDWNLSASSPYATAATDGGPLGAIF